MAKTIAPEKHIVWAGNCTKPCAMRGAAASKVVVSKKQRACRYALGSGPQWEKGTDMKKQ